MEVLIILVDFQACVYLLLTCIVFIDLWCCDDSGYKGCQHGCSPFWAILITILPFPPSCFLCTSLRYSSSSWSVSWLKGLGGSGSVGTLGGLIGDWRTHKIIFLKLWNTRGGHRKKVKNTKIYWRTVNSYNAGKDLRLWPCRLHVLAILLSDLQRRTMSYFHIELVGDRHNFF